MNIREKNGGTYDPILSENLNADIEAAIVDVNGFYFISTSKDKIIRIYFECFP